MSTINVKRLSPVWENAAIGTEQTRNQQGNYLQNNKKKMGKPFKFVHVIVFVFAACLILEKLMGFRLDLGLIS